MDEDNRLPDSIITAEVRSARIKEAAAKIEAEEKAREEQRVTRENRDRDKARAEEDEYVKKIGLVTSERTMESLHERIREMRKPPPDPEKDRPPPFLTERQAAQIAAEIEGGRQASERVRLREEAVRLAREKMDAEEKAKAEAHAKVDNEYKEPITMPNPLQSQVFPTDPTKTTLR
jgi:hypothetical protein